jgi:hypothetical protein
VEDVEAAAQGPDAEVAPPGWHIPPDRIKLTLQAATVLEQGLTETRVRDFLYRKLQQVLRPEAVLECPVWPKGKGPYRLYHTALGSDRGTYLIYLILADPSAAGEQAPVRIVAAEIEFIR